MEPHKSIKKGIEFSEEEVYIILPEKYKHIKVKKFDDPGTYITDERGRVVMKFEFYDPFADDKKKKEFTEPVELRIRFTAADVTRAEGVEKLVLLYSENGDWQEFSNPVDMIYEGEGEGGYGVVLIKKWDPAVGWFP